MTVQDLQAQVGGSLEFLRWLMGAVGLLIIALTNLHLRHKHNKDVFAIWYLFSLTTILGAIGLYWFVHNVENDHGLSDAIREFENEDNERLLVGLFLLVAVAPQIIAYLLSGLSGSAVAPPFVGSVTRLAVWSLIKFYATAAGLRLGTGIGLNLAKQGNAYTVPYSIQTVLPELGLSFGLTFCLLRGSEFLGQIAHQQRTAFVRQRLSELHAFFIRGQTRSATDKPLVWATCIFVLLLALILSFAAAGQLQVLENKLSLLIYRNSGPLPDKRAEPVP